MAVDGNNDVIVTGYSTGSGTGNDYATIKYSSAGTPLWTNRYARPGNGDDSAYAVAVDGSNNVIVTGSSIGTGGNYDYATIMYSSAGIPIWTNRFGLENGPDRAWAVAVDHSNNVIVTGSSYGGRSSPDYTTIKYSSAGVPLWTNRYNGPSNGGDYAFAVAVDAGNNVIVTGYSDGGKGNDDYATIKYSSTGALLWANRYNGLGDGSDYAWALAVDRSGNVIVTGESHTGDNSAFATIKYICVPEPVVTGLSQTNGTFQMRVDGVLQPGTLVIEACTNLFATNWEGVFTNTTPTNVLFYTDPDAGSAPTRFYRAFQFP
jgi:hypothetical protein